MVAAAFGVLAGAGLVGAAVCTDAGDQSALNSAGSCLIAGGLGSLVLGHVCRKKQLEQQLPILSKELAGATSKLKEAEAQVTSLQTQMQTLREQFDRESGQAYEKLRTTEEAQRSRLESIRQQESAIRTALVDFHDTGKGVLIPKNLFSYVDQISEPVQDMITVDHAYVYLSQLVEKVAKLTSEKDDLQAELTRLQEAVVAAEEKATEVSAAVDGIESAAQQIAKLQAALEEKERSVRSMAAWCEQLEESLSVKSAEAQEYVRGLIERDPSVVIHELVEWYQRVHGKDVTRDESGNTIFPQIGTQV